MNFYSPHTRQKQQQLVKTFNQTSEIQKKKKKDKTKNENDNVVITSKVQKKKISKSVNISKIIENDDSHIKNQKNSVYNYKNQNSTDDQKLRQQIQSLSMSQKPLQMQKGRIKLQVTPKKFDRQKMRGLRNMGNTCYINSSLQCLHKTQLLYKNLKISNKNSDCIKSYLQMCQKLYQPTNEPFIPKKIKQLMAQQNDMFAGNDQNDSAQLLNYLLNKLHDDSNLIQNPVMIKLPPNSNTLQDKQLCNLYAERDFKRQKSIINDIFTGRYKTSYICQECNSTMRLFQKFNIVYLPIPKNSNNNSITLSQCLTQFQKDEILNQWPCKIGCGGKQTKTVKKLQIFRKNKILILCLKRFDLNLKKMNTSIKIQGQIFNENGQNYELYGIVNHVGSVNSGHYFAYCYNQDYQRWLEYNDSTVSQIQNPQNKASSSAYILFYRQKSSSQIKQKLQE